MFDEIRQPTVKQNTEEHKKKARDAARARNAEKKAMKIASGEKMPRAGMGGPPLGTVNNPNGRPKSIINRVTEYGATFNKMNEEAIAKGHGPLTSAMETLIMAMNSDQLDIKEKARIADKLAAFESSRAPIISIEHVNNMVNSEENVSADEALDDFMNSLRKV